MKININVMSINNAINKVIIRSKKYINIMKCNVKWKYNQYNNINKSIILI